LCLARKKRLAVGGQTVKAKTNETVLKIDINFKCSSGRLQHFKQRGNITWHSVSGEYAAADMDSAKKWQENVKPSMPSRTFSM
jgi:hypothetical protein